jgi:predicted TIM-barrel fold metal-dependent hydrolase
MLSKHGGSPSGIKNLLEAVIAGREDGDQPIARGVVGNFPKSDRGRVARHTTRNPGSDRILFGSDQMVWPQMITSAIESIRDAPFLSDQDKRNILGENARRLLKLVN